MREIDQKEALDILEEGRDFTNGIHDNPAEGQVVITGLQAGNFQGQIGWDRYLGYVVQVRKGAGAFGSDLYFLLHPNGVLSTHENQSLYSVPEDIEKRILALYDEEDRPEKWHFGIAVSIGGKYSEIGFIIEKPAPLPPNKNAGGALDLVVEKADGSKEMHRFID